MVPLADGLVLRTATPADLGSIGALLADRGEEADAEDLELVAGDPDAGLGGTAVVVDGSRVVSTLTLLDESMVVGDVRLPAGQVELVATDRGFEGRGLVRSLMAWLYDESARRGHVVQLVVGIPYFYRQLGFEYGLPLHRDRAVASPLPPPAPGLTVRAATAEDIPAMAALEDAAQASADVRLAHAPACWRWLVGRSGSQQWLVEDSTGAAVATGRTDEGVRLGELAATTEGAALALAHHAVQLGGGTAAVKERPGTVAGDAVAPFLEAGEKADWCYVRAADPVALLERLRPVLSARLAAAGWDTAQEVLLSGYRWHTRFTVGRDGAGPMAGGRAEQAPVSKGGSGVAPDAFASLVFGPFGAIGLEERVPDVHLGRQRELMGVLFPPIRADLLTFYLP